MAQKNKLPSKAQIDKSGELLKLDLPAKQLSQPLSVLSDWRSYHSGPLSNFAKTLKRRAVKISEDPDVLVAQRLKRTSSIQLKLRKHKTMRLSTMQDIGGVRAILKNTEDVYKLYNLYIKSKKIHKLHSYNDYISQPKGDGYRGIHLVYQLNKDPSLFIEIQMRSHLQHIWATGVEVFGTLRNSSFKSGYGEKKWLEFFLYLSAVFAIKENSPIPLVVSKNKILSRTKKLIKSLKVIEQLSVYTAVYDLTTQIEMRGRKGNYSLITLDSDKKKIQFQNFSSKDSGVANKEYIKLEEQYFYNPNVNIVLVNTSDVKKLKASYPNYFMDTQLLIQNLSLLVMDESL